MKLEENKYIYIRSLIFLVIFIILHYTYDWFPNIVFQIFSGTNESVFQHMKIGFYAYIILILLEYGIFRKDISNRGNFFFSRIFSAVLYSWVMFLFFFFSRVVYPNEFHFVVEILVAQIATYVSVLVLGFIEVELNKIEFSKRMKVITIVLLVLLIIEFTAFSFYLPWHDLLADPYI